LEKCNVRNHFAAPCRYRFHLADEVVAVEFSGAPPRGAEYTAADMVAAGARLEAYVVMAFDYCVTTSRSDGY